MPFSISLLAYLLPCVTSALTALIAWQGFQRLREDTLRDTATAFALTGALQAILLANSSSNNFIAPPLLHGLDGLALTSLSWAFFGSRRRMFLVIALTVCSVLTAFTLSLWQLLGAEPVWATTAWGLVISAILGATTISVWQHRSEQTLALVAGLGLLTLSYLIGAAEQAEAALVARLAALPLVMVAVMQFATCEMENVRSELVSFSEHSLRQTQQLLTLLRASTAFIGNADIEPILNEAVEGVALGVGADQALVALLDDAEGRRLHVYATYPSKPALIHQVIPLHSQPSLAEAIRLGQPVHLTPPHHSLHTLAALMGSNAGPAIIQPLMGNGRAFGVMVALNGRHQRAFTENEQRVMEAFGGQVATAAEKALLDQLVQAQTRELAEMLTAREAQASRQAAILESIADGVLVFDDKERVIAANPAAQAVLELGLADLVGQPLPAVLGDQMPPDDRATLQSLVKGQVTLMSASKIRWGNKTVSVSVAPVRMPSATRHGTVIVLHDITADAKLDRMKSEFVSVVSHELRSPFAMLDSSVQVIRKYGLDHLLPEQREQFQQLGEGLVRAEIMINNLVTFAAFLSKQGQLRVNKLNLGELARDAVQELAPMARARNVTVELELADELPPLYGDRDRLIEAIYHLVHNAIKFNRPGGRVIVACRSAPDSAVLEVADTGIGIPTEQLAAVWKDFSQLADPLRRGVEGLGLGLPLVRYVVQAHGGQVWADSQTGQGSVFGFCLPDHPSTQPILLDAVA